MGGGSGAEPVINHIFASPDGSEYVLVLVEVQPWDHPGVLDALAQRIELCAAAVTDGSLAAQLPETTGRRIRVHVDHMIPADAAASALFARAETALAEHGIQFTAELLVEPDKAASRPGQRRRPWSRRHHT